MIVFACFLVTLYARPGIRDYVARSVNVACELCVLCLRARARIRERTRERVNIIINNVI